MQTTLVQWGILAEIQLSTQGQCAAVFTCADVRRSLALQLGSTRRSAWRRRIPVPSATRRDAASSGHGVVDAPECGSQSAVQSSVAHLHEACSVGGALCLAFFLWNFFREFLSAWTLKASDRAPAVAGVVGANDAHLTGINRLLVRCVPFGASLAR